METPALGFLRHRVLPALLLLATHLLLRGAEPASAPAPAFDIGVRSSVDERWKGFHKGGAIEHGKVYGIVSI